MHIAFVSTHDPRDISAWSGTAYYMSRALAEGGDVSRIGPLHDPLSIFHRLDMRAREMLGLRATVGSRSSVSARGLGRQVRRRLPGTADVVLATATLPLAYLKTNIPTAVWSDATFAALVGFYPAFSRLSRRALRQGHDLERRALDRCALAIYSSEWAAKSAVERYGCPPEKVRVVPFGANLDAIPAAIDVEAIVGSRPTSTCRLLFVGSEWERKGGDLAVAATGRLRERGLDARLDLVGTGPGRLDLPDYVQRHGRLDKRRPADVARLADLYRRSHFLVLPTRQECFGIVYCEAAAFGLPVVTADVGGVSTAVRDGVNGVTLAPAAGAEEYADAIARTFLSGDVYADLVRNARSEYEHRLNWRTAAGRVRALLAEIAWTNSEPAA